MKKTESKLDRVLSFDAYMEVPEELRSIAGDYFDMHEDTDTATVHELLVEALENSSTFKALYKYDLAKGDELATKLLNESEAIIKTICKYIAE